MMRKFCTFLAVAGLFVSGALCGSVHAGTVGFGTGFGGTETAWPTAWTDQESGEMTVDGIKLSASVNTGKKFKITITSSADRLSIDGSRIDAGEIVTLSFDKEVNIIGFKFSGSGDGFTLSSTGFSGDPTVSSNSGDGAIAYDTILKRFTTSEYKKNYTIALSGSAPLTLTANTALTIEGKTGTGNGAAKKGGKLEYIVVEKVPEPSSALLATFGLAGLGLVRRRRRS